MNSKCVPSQKLFDNPGGEIASLNPNDLGRRTQALGQVHEIPIRADDSRKCRLSGPVENEWIGCSHEIVIIHGLKSGNDVC